MTGNIHFDLRGILSFPRGRLKYTGINRVTIEWAKRFADQYGGRFMAPGFSAACAACLQPEPGCQPIVDALAKDESWHERYSAVIADRLPVPLENRSPIAKARRKISAAVEGWAFDGNTRSFLRRASNGTPSIYFCPFTHRLPRNLPPSCIPVFNIFDIIPLLFWDPIFGDTRKLRQTLLQLSRSDSYFVVNSRDCRHTLVSMFDIPNERIFLVPLGVDLDQDVEAGATIPESPVPYFLYVCSDVQRRKNIETTIRAFNIFLERTGLDFELLIVGGGTDSIEPIIRRNAPEHGSKVKGLGRVPESVLRSLYQEAECGLFLSLYEGFGLPVLEYMKNGTPVICSNVTSIPEVAGDCAVCVDPLSTGRIVEAMIRVSADPSFRSDLSARGRIRAAEFSWDRSAATLMEAFQTILSTASSAERSIH